MNKTARDLVQGQQLAWIRPDAMVDQALQLMTKHEISSLPVIEVPSESTVPTAGAFKGFIDILDLLAFLASIGTRSMTNPYGTGESRSISTDDLATLHRRSKEFRIAQCIEVCNFGKRNPPHKVNMNMNLKDLINFFGKSNERIHRVAVVDDNLNLIGVLTQSMLLRCIYGNLTNFSELNNIKARSLRMTEAGKLVTVPVNCTAFEAFLKMHQECLSSLTVASQSGDVCDNLSASDLKGALTDFKRLNQPVIDYLNTTRSLVLGRKPRKGLVSCPLDASLREVLGIVNDTKVHRVYVLDEQHKPVGVVSLTDICHNLLSVLC